MKGQMRFDNSGAVSEEPDCRPQKTERPLMNDPCYYCLCNSCINNAESRTITPDELKSEKRERLEEEQPC